MVIRSPFAGFSTQRSCTHGLLYRVVSYCLLAIFGLSIVLGQDLAEPKNTDRSVTSLHALVDNQNPNQPLDSPIEPDSAPAESQDEKDLNDSLDDDWGKVFWGYTQEHGARKASNEISFSQYVRSIQNRNTVSLFVLHHAWKSSIC